MAGLDPNTFSVLGDLPYQRVRRLISLGLGVGIQASVLFLLVVVGILIPSKIEPFIGRAPIYVKLATPDLTKNALIPKKLKPKRIQAPEFKEKRIQELIIPIDRSIPIIKPLETNIHTSLPVRQIPTVALAKNIPKPEPNPVTTGVFEYTKKIIPKPEPNPVTTGVFGNSNGIIGDAKGSSLGNVAKLGSFDFLPGRVHGNLTRKAGNIERGVVSSGFNGGVSPPGNNTSKKSIVRSGGFDKKPSLNSPGNPLHKTVAGLPVKIISKPKPIYSEEGIRLGIEGDVVLEVIFMASGQIKVLKVLEGLGHGLDESACIAAEKIKFQPGQRQGNPVNVKGRLRVIFKLAGGGQ